MGSVCRKNPNRIHALRTAQRALAALVPGARDVRISSPSCAEPVRRCGWASTRDIDIAAKRLVVASPSGLANAAFKRTIVAAIGGNPPEPCNLSHERQSPTAGGALALSMWKVLFTRWGHDAFASRAAPASRCWPGTTGRLPVSAGQALRCKDFERLQSAFAHAAHAARRSARRTACSARRSSTGSGQRAQAKPGPVAGVFAHYLHELIPLRTLGRGNAELGIQLFDPLLDPFFGGPVGRRVSCHW